MALNLDTLGLSAKVTAEGISAPDYPTILDTLTAFFRQIYGADSYLEPDSKDGQMIAVYALALHDANNTAITVYNSFSPSTAFGAGLAKNVRINGLVKRSATNSTVDEELTGEVGLVIQNGKVRDRNGLLWNLPHLVSIGLSGTAMVTATCDTPGAVVALPGSITQIATPTRGWYSCSNPRAATVGKAGEKDSELRARQSKSVALPSTASFDGILGALATVDGVTHYHLYENDSGNTDANGLPPHSVAAIVGGGDVKQIATVLQRKKGQGVTTFGTIKESVPDRYGNPHLIYFSRTSYVPVYVQLQLHAFSGYTTQIGEEIKSAIAAYISTLSIGDDVLLSRVYSPANLDATRGGNSRYYDVMSLEIGRSADNVFASNIAIAFNETALCAVENIRITVTS